MNSNIRLALVITKREIRDQFRDWRVIFPIVGLTIFFPFLMNFTASQILGFVQKYGATIVGERLVPFLFMIVGFFPISVSLVIALESFVGEKERGSIEPLLNSPLKDWQLYLGKLLAAVVPPLLSSYLGMLVYLGGLTYNRIPIPGTDLMVLIVSLTTVQAVMMVSGAVVVSTQATSVRSANLLASFIIIPVSLLIQGESVIMFWGDINVLWWIVFGLGLITLLLVRVGLAHFQREELLGRDLDVLNLRWAWRTFLQEFTGGAVSIRQWYFKILPVTIRGLRLPVLLVCILGVSGFIIGVLQVGQINLPGESSVLMNIGVHLEEISRVWPLLDFRPVLMVFWQNLRVLLLAFVLGIFSIGIFGSLPFIATMGVAGFLYRVLLDYGISTAKFAVFVLPHGIIEIPVAVLVSAAILKAGAMMATPYQGKTVGEVWIISVATWSKMMVGVAVPMLFLSACIEVWITPRLAMLIF